MSAPGTYRTGTIAAVVITVELVAWAVGIGLLYALPSSLPQFRIQRPEVLWALLAGPVLVLAYLAAMALKNKALKRFSDEPLRARMAPDISSWRLALKFLLLRHGFSFAIIALAGPQMGTRLEEVTAKGVDVMVAMDVSNSMLAEDLKPDRMEVAKRALSQLIDNLGSDRLGIVVFAGEAYTLLPITADRSAAKLFLSSLGPNLVRTQGTAIGEAIDLARKGFGPDAAKSKTIIAITDGESFEDDGEAAAKRAAQEGIIVNTIGLGSDQGAPIPVRIGDRMVGFKKDKDGQTVITRLNSDMLARIAAAGHGEYIHATSADAGVSTLVAKVRGMDQSDLGSYKFAGHEDRFQYFLTAACVLILFGLLIGERTIHLRLGHYLPWHA